MRYYNVIQSILYSILVTVAYSDCNLYAAREDSVGIIHMAAEAGDLNCVQERITAGDDPNLKTSQGSSVLHFAYQGRHAQNIDEVSKLLIDNGADIKSPNDKG